MFLITQKASNLHIFFPSFWVKPFFAFHCILICVLLRIFIYWRNSYLDYAFYGYWGFRTLNLILILTLNLSAIIQYVRLILYHLILLSLVYLCV